MSDTFGRICETCGEFNATNVCMVCLARDTGAVVTVTANGTLVLMPTVKG